MPGRDLPQRLVPDGVAVLVIDALEMIDVDDEAAYRPAGLRRLRDGMADLGIEAARG